MCLCGCGGMVGAVGPGSVKPAWQILPDGFVPFRCGVVASIVTMVLGVVYSVMLGWCCIGPLPCCCGALCGGWQGVAGRLEQGWVWSLCSVDVSSSAFRGWSSSAGLFPCGEGIHAIWAQGHVINVCILVGDGSVGKLMLGFVVGGGLNGVEIGIHGGAECFVLRWFWL
ncbi:hypothetical protein AMECASPLE_037992, partial [Ameca splendens]